MKTKQCENKKTKCEKTQDLGSNFGLTRSYSHLEQLYGSVDTRASGKATLYLIRKVVYFVGFHVAISQTRAPPTALLVLLESS
jgi:hypothetical protein